VLLGGGRAVSRVRAREGPLVRRVVEALNALPGTRAVKSHVSPYARKGEPDVRGVARGRAFFLEVKAPGREGTLSELQAVELRRWAEVGAATGVATSVAEAVAFARQVARWARYDEAPGGASARHPGPLPSGPLRPSVDEGGG
jgi:hypothetical protein